MPKKIAVINDLSGFGRCSLTAAISVLSAMGVQACPLPTAILSAQTGYPSYYCDDYTEKMDIFRREWAKIGQSFDGIYTGFVAGPEQIHQIFRFIDTFRTSATFLLVDPIMGDNGQTFPIYSPKLLMEMRKLTNLADIITPNLTEFCLLTGADYQELSVCKTAKELLDSIEKRGLDYCQDGPNDMIVTGIQITGADGAKQIGNLHIGKNGSHFCSCPYIGGSYSGTGDLFASCIAAGIARDERIPDIMQRAGEFLRLALLDSVRENIPRNDGVNYEKYLPMLMQS